MSLNPSHPSRATGPRLSDEIPRLFGFDPWAAWSDSGLSPMTWTRAADAVVLRVELPGVPAEQIDVSLEADLLTLSVAEAGEEPSGHRFAGFRRTLRVKEPFDPEQINATTLDGVLTISLRKAPETLPRRIPIQNG